MKLITIARILKFTFIGLGFIFLVLILNKGNEAIQASAALGNYGVVSSFITLAIVVLIVIVAVTILFTFVSLGENPKALRKSLISVGLFGLIFLISYLLSSGVETPMKDGNVLSSSSSRLVGAGLRMFYILVVVALLSMVSTDLKRILKL